MAPSAALQSKVTILPAAFWSTTPNTTQTAMRLAEQLKAHVQAAVLDALFGGNPDIEVTNIRFSYAGSKGMYAGGIHVVDSGIIGSGSRLCTKNVRCRAKSMCISTGKGQAVNGRSIYLKYMCADNRSRWTGQWLKALVTH
jgi:hypothetical protein